MEFFRVGEMGVGEMGIGEMGQIIGETGVGEMGGAGQKIPWTKAPMPFFAEWTKDPTLLHQGGQKIPH